MKYIYDIFLNFNGEFFEFFDWHINDDIIHIKKIPVYRISSDNLNKIVGNKIKIDKILLNSIKNKTEVFNKNTVSLIDYSLLLSDGNMVFSVCFDSNGYSTKYSSLLVDEEEDIIEIIECINEYDIKYELITTNKNLNYDTRIQKKIRKYLTKELNKIENKKQYDKMKYLYYELYNKIENNTETIIKKFKSELSGEWSNMLDKMNDVFRLTSISKM